MAGNNPYKAYQQNQVETASQEELLLMLYRGALRFLGRAKKALEEKDIESSHHNLVRTQDILTELMSSLNYERENDEVGELVGGLFSVYEYMHRQLVQANVKKEVAPVEEVQRMFRSLLEAWEQAVQPAASSAAAESGEPAESRESVSRLG